MLGLAKVVGHPYELTELPYPLVPYKERQKQSH